MDKILCYQLEIICYAGKSTIDEGFYKFSAKRFEKLTTGSKKSITLPIEKKVTVKRNCQKVYEGENINILISSMNGLIKLNFNKIPGQIK